MPTRFVHAADIHLGFRQYGSPQRYNDFAAALERLVDATIDARADFFLLAGDLFHKRSIDPLTLWQATSILARLGEAGIAAYAVQGNHERPHTGEAASWLDYLAQLGVLRVLSTRFGRDGIIVDPWSAEQKRGTYVDLPGGIRILGLPYYGSSTGRAVQDLVKALEADTSPRPAYTILMMHAGLQGVLDNYAATLSRAQLDPLHPYVDYLALGHIHKPFCQDDWIFNPGSPETCSIAEAAWEDRGYFVVDVDPAHSPAHAVTAVRNPRRPFLRYPFAVEGHNSPAALEQALLRHLAREASARLREQKPVVQVDLVGTLPFGRADLDFARLEARVADLFAATACRVRDDTAPADFEVATATGLTRPELERHVLRELIERDVRRRQHSADWADLVLRVKQMALTGSGPGEIVDELAALTRLLAEREAAGPGERAEESADEDLDGETGAPC